MAEEQEMGLKAVVQALGWISDEYHKGQVNAHLLTQLDQSI